MGSDRMSGEKHSYSSCYAKFLSTWRRLVERRPEAFTPLLVAEVGILKGSGLAIWSDLFGCDARIHGFDMVLENTQKNMAFMKSRGAFEKENLELHFMNQMEDNSATVGKAAGGKKFAFVVDDGYHTTKSIWLTFQSFKPHLHKSFLYIVEDIHVDEIGKMRKSFSADYHLETCDADARIIMVTPK